MSGVTQITVRFSRSAVATAILAALALSPASASFGKESPSRTIEVAGTGTDLLNGAIVHSKTTTATGEILKSTEIVELNGDLIGKVLYHVTTVIDLQKNTLTNTGDEVFSGTIAGSEPVMIHDAKFRFDVDLSTGVEIGSVHFADHIAGPPVKCDLKVTGTGKSVEGNPTFRYGGTCRFESRRP